MTFPRRNDALDLNGNTVNGRTADIHITKRGSDLYFAISAAMAVAGFVFLFLSMFKPRRNRIFHYLTASIVWVAAIAYFTMGSNLGFTPIGVEFRRGRGEVRGRYREIFYVRYIDWFITTPLLLLDLLLTAGMPWPKILFVIFVDWIMIIMGLIGALVQSTYKFGYFAIGCFALFYILYELGWTARQHAAALGPDISRAYIMCGCLTLLLWILYPIAWGLCEGGNYIAPDSEAIFYSVLDFIAKIGFGALLLWGHRNIDPARLGMAIREYDQDPSVYRGLMGVEEEEKKTGGGHGVGTEGTRVDSATATRQAPGAPLPSRSYAGPAAAVAASPTSAAPGIAAPASTSAAPTPAPTVAVSAPTPPATTPPPAASTSQAKQIPRSQLPIPGNETHDTASAVTTKTPTSSLPIPGNKTSTEPVSTTTTTPASSLPIPKKRDSAEPKSASSMPPSSLPIPKSGTTTSPTSATKKSPPSYLPIPGNVTASPPPGVKKQRPPSSIPTSGKKKAPTRSPYIPPPGDDTAALEETEEGGIAKAAPPTDTISKANASVDDTTKAETLRPGTPSTPKTYAEAIRAASHGAIGGGPHAT